MFCLRRTLIVLGLLAWMGCLPDLNIPDGTIVSCTADKHCPTGYVCVDQRQCVPKGRTDLDAPSVVEVTVNGVAALEFYAAVAREFTIAIETSEPLGRSPVLELRPPSDRSQVITLEGNGSGMQWTFVYTPTPTDGDGAVLQVLLLQDRAGNQALSTLPVDLHFDQFAPTIDRSASLLPKVVYYPIVTNVLRNVAAATTSTETLISFSTTEPVEVSLHFPAAAALEFVEVNSFLTVFVYRALVENLTAPTEGYGDIEVTMVDRSGQSVTEALQLTPAFGVDTIAPAAVATDNPAVALDRQPWGDVQGAVIGTRVTGPRATVDAGAQWLLALSGLDTRTELGRVQLVDGIPFDLDLGPADRSAVYLAAVDAAGNLGPISAVRNGRWIASTAAAPGASNPHRFAAGGFSGGGLGLDNEVTISLIEEGALGKADDVSARSQALGWWSQWQMQSFAALPNRASMVAVYEPNLRQTWALGGYLKNTSTTAVDCVAQGDGHISTRDALGWSLVPSVGPNWQKGDLVFDPHQNAVIFFGETGVWRGISPSQWEVIGTSVPSLITASTAAAYDRRRGVTLVYTAGALGEWDGTQLRQVCTQSPCADLVPAGEGKLAYSRALGEVLLYNQSGQTWSFDGTRWLQRCTQIPCSEQTPGPRWQPAFTTEEQNGHPVLLGGRTSAAGSQTLPHLWLFDGDTWTVVDDATSGEVPTSNRDAELIYDQNIQKLIYFGGTNHNQCGGMNSRVHTWDSVSGWTIRNESTALQPDASSFHSAAYDAINGEVVVAGGGLSSTYSWKGRAWASENGDPEYGTTLATRQNGQVYHYGGNHLTLTTDSETLMYYAPGIAAGWSAACSSNCGTRGSSRPWALTFAAMAPYGAGMLLFGGSRYPDPVVTNGAGTIFDAADLRADTWTWSGTAWQSTTTGPSARAHHRMAPTAEGGILMHGGHNSQYTDAFADTWLYSQGSWQSVTAAMGPGARAGHVMALDSSRGVVVLTSGGVRTVGSNGSTVAIPAGHADVWEWYDGAWHLAFVAAKAAPGSYPVARLGAAWAAYEPDGKVVLVGGNTTGSVGTNGFVTSGLAETWLWDGGAASRPMHKFTVTTAAAGVHDHAWSTAVIDWYGRAQSDIGAQLDLSIELWVHNGIGWQALTTTEVIDGQWQATLDFAQLWPESILRGAGRDITLAAVTGSGNGIGPRAWLDSDFVQVTFNYAAPQ